MGIAKARIVVKSDCDARIYISLKYTHGALYSYRGSEPAKILAFDEHRRT